jgi:hypothetical protein
MYALIGLAAFIVLVDLAAILGWGADSRDPEWTPAVSAFGRGSGADHRSRRPRG